MAIPVANLLSAIIDRSGKDDTSQEWLDQALPELIAYLVAGPAVCKQNEWIIWDDLPDTVQAVLVGVLARHSTIGLGSIVQEQIGDYSIRYSDPALFEGRIPRYFTDGEEHTLSRLSGCFSTLYSVSSGGLPIHDMTIPEDSLGGGRLPAEKSSEVP